MSDLQKITEATLTINALVLKEEYAYMREPWKMLLGGMILPEVAKIDPHVLDDAGRKAIYDNYTKDKIIQSLSSKVVEKPIPVVATQVVVADKVKYRRLKDKGVQKQKRMVRPIDTYDRDVIIEWWNANQTLVTNPDDPICKNLADQINAARPNDKPLAAAQVSGYFSHLCRLGLEDEKYRSYRLAQNLKYGNINVIPVYTDSLLKLIRDNNVAEKADKKARKEDHDQMRVAKKQGYHLKVAVPLVTKKDMVPNLVSETAQEEVFDIKFL